SPGPAGQDEVQRGVPGLHVLTELNVVPGPLLSILLASLLPPAWLVPRLPKPSCAAPAHRAAARLRRGGRRGRHECGSGRPARAWHARGAPGALAGRSCTPTPVLARRYSGPPPQ